MASGRHSKLEEEQANTLKKQHVRTAVAIAVLVIEMHLRVAEIDPLGGVFFSRPCGASRAECGVLTCHRRIAYDI